MSLYTLLSQEELEKEYEIIRAKYSEIKQQDLRLDMSRGKPSAIQLDITNKLLACVNETEGIYTESGADSRNYGLLEGTDEARKLMGDIMGTAPEETLVCGSSSLSLMYDTISRGVSHGFVDSKEPWSKCENRKFICICPGYDRHFAITDFFGFELITVPMTATGPDMDEVERLVKDENVKGIWCVPKYSNPSGECYSDETVRRLASMKTGAEDFKIMWDNAYGIHDIYEDEYYHLLDILNECKIAGNPNRPIYFSSTSKVSFPGAGISAMAANKENINFIKKQMSIQIICFDKTNMMRHTNYFKNIEGVMAHMKLQASFVKPKFQAVYDKLSAELGELGIASWTNPKGGYFISFTSLDGCAKQIVELCKDAGATLTPAGATYPHGNDIRDNNIRIAPTYPPMEELKGALEVFCVVVKLVSIEKIMRDKKKNVQ